MIKYLLKKLISSIFHSKHRHNRYTSSHHAIRYNRRYSSSHRGHGPRQGHQGHGYYRNSYHSSS